MHIVEQQLKALKAVPLDNITAIGRQIMRTLSVIRDAKKEIKESVDEMVQNECIQQIDPWNFDYSKLQTLKNEDDDDNKQNVAERITTNNADDDGLDGLDELDLLLLGINDSELSQLQSLRAWQILEIIGFVDSVVHHIYLFVIKHLKANPIGNRIDFQAQKQWLTRLAESVTLVPQFVDELSCCLYPPHPPDDAVCRSASNLLHFVWRVSIEIAEESKQYKNRKMVIKNKSKKKKVSLTGNEWKWKFVNLSVTFGEWFGLGTMEHIQRFMENDPKYAKQREEKEQKKAMRKKEKTNKKKRFKKKQKRNGNRKRKESAEQEHNVSASSEKRLEQESNGPTETSQTASITSNVIDEEPDSDDMVNID